MPKVIQPGKGRAQIHNQDYQTSGRTDGLVLTVNRVTANMFRGLLCAKLWSKHLHGLAQASVERERAGKDHQANGRKSFCKTSTVSDQSTK